MRTQEEIVEVCKKHNTMLFDCQMTTPDGGCFQYARMIDMDQLATMTEKMFKFYTDDLHYAFWTAIKETQGE